MRSMILFTKKTVCILVTQACTWQPMEKYILVVIFMEKMFRKKMLQIVLTIKTS